MENFQSPKMPKIAHFVGRFEILTTKWAVYVVWVIKKQRFSLTREQLLKIRGHFSTEFSVVCPTLAGIVPSDFPLVRIEYHRERGDFVCTFQPTTRSRLLQPPHH